MLQKNPDVTYSVIGADLIVTGQIQSKSPIQLDGKIMGDIHCPALDVEKQAIIKGGVVTEDLIVYGKINGSIKCANASLQRGANVEADIDYGSISVEEGASLQGGLRCTRKVGA